MITAETLLSEGFKEFQVPHGSKHHKGADRFFQTCIRTNDGQKLYHVNAYLYDWTKYTQYVGPQVSVTYEVWAYANIDRTDHFTICYSPRTDQTIAEVMAFMAVAWGRLSSVPYEREEIAA